MIVNSAAENLLSHTIKSTLYCQTVAWMSHNQLACGYDDGTFEVHEIESTNKQLKGKMVQKNRHDLGDHEHVCITVTIPQNFNLQGGIRSAVTSIAMNKELNLLASGGSDNRLKVFLKTKSVLLLYQYFDCLEKIVIGRDFELKIINFFYFSITDLVFG
jgi:WD40 repeat protein